MDETSTKSIDVGGIFLMDLTVNESDPSNHIDCQLLEDRYRTICNRTGTDAAAAAPYYIHRNHDKRANVDVAAHDDDDEEEPETEEETETATTHQMTSSIARDYQAKQQKQRASNTIYRQPDYLSSSLDRLASVINCDEQQYQLHQEEEQDDVDDEDEDENEKSDDEEEEEDDEREEGEATLSLVYNDYDDDRTVNTVDQQQSPTRKHQRRYHLYSQAQPVPFGLHGTKNLVHSRENLFCSAWLTAHSRALQFSIENL